MIKAQRLAASHRAGEDPGGAGERRRPGADRQLAVHASARVRSAGARARPAPGSFPDTGQDVGYHTAMEYRFVRGGFTEPGPAVVWMRMRHPLIAGEEPSPLAEGAGGRRLRKRGQRDARLGPLPVHQRRAHGPRPSRAGRRVGVPGRDHDSRAQRGRGRRHGPLRRARPGRARRAGAADRRARERGDRRRGSSSAGAGGAGSLLPAGMALLAEGCEVVEGGLDAEPRAGAGAGARRRRDRRRPHGRGRRGAPGRGGAAAPRRRQLRRRARQRRPRRLPAAGRRGHQHRRACSPTPRRSSPWR